MTNLHHYADRLQQQLRIKSTPALVGLDPRFDQIPAAVKSQVPAGLSPCETQARAYELFCRKIIDIVAPLVPAVKPQVAFFEECGPAGMQALWNVIQHARRQGLIVIADAKRGDIGSTAQGYARAWLAGADVASAPWGADALTINPYMGADTLQPFLDLAHERGAGLYVLVRTSNPGAKDFQDRKTDGQTLYQRVAEVVQQLSSKTVGQCGYGFLGAVVGATYPAELLELRQSMPRVPLLVPGYGSQGGTSADVAGAFDQNGQGALVNSSRGIIFAWERKEYRDQFGVERWEQAVEAATRAMVADLATNAVPAAR
ncbi:MAG: orotidine-5'-phosphate decarboxylase [Planctomycetaceae bacterium]